MAKRINLSLYLVYSAVCAVLYCVPVLFLLINKLFQNSWLLFLGNGLFLMCVLFSIIHVNKKLYENGNLRTLVYSGIGLTIGSLFVIAVLLLILFFSFDLSSHHVTGSGVTIKQGPSGEEVNGGTPGDFLFMLMISGLFVNLFVGSFAAFIAAVTAKERQTTEKGKKAYVKDNVTD